MSATLFVIHWNAREADDYADVLRAKGWNVIGVEAQDGGRAARLIREKPPDFLVVYLTRSPSHGRETAEYVSRLKQTQDVKIVFVGGEGHALSKTQFLLPDAHYITETDDVSNALESLLEPNLATA